MKYVYIPTRGRPDNVKKQNAAWSEYRDHFMLIYVVEPQEAAKPYTDDCEHLFVLDENDKGIAYARNAILSHANIAGQKSIIISDDDIKPAKGYIDEFREFARGAEHWNVLGITARYAYVDLAMQHKIDDFRGVAVLPTGAFRMIALNVENATRLGGYDDKLTCAQEDGDLMLRGLADGYPWLVDYRTWCLSIGYRYAEGGLSEYFAAKGEHRASGVVTYEELENHRYLHDKFPNFVNKPRPPEKVKRGNGIRIKWQDAYDHHLRSDWRKYSEVHGGTIKEYFE